MGAGLVKALGTKALVLGAKKALYAAGYLAKKKGLKWAAKHGTRWVAKNGVKWAKRKAYKWVKTKGTGLHRTRRHRASSFGKC